MNLKLRAAAPECEMLFIVLMLLPVTAILSCQSIPVMSIFMGGDNTPRSQAEGSDTDRLSLGHKTRGGGTGQVSRGFPSFRFLWGTNGACNEWDISASQNYSPPSAAGGARSFLSPKPRILCWGRLENCSHDQRDTLSPRGRNWLHTDRGQG